MGVTGDQRSRIFKSLGSIEMSGSVSRGELLRGLDLRRALFLNWVESPWQLLIGGGSCCDSFSRKSGVASDVRRNGGMEIGSCRNLLLVVRSWNLELAACLFVDWFCWGGYLGFGTTHCRDFILYMFSLSWSWTLPKRCSRFSFWCHSFIERLKLTEIYLSVTFIKNLNICTILWS